MKGIILAGGNGTRLYPMTYGISKQLLPVYDKPMIYYPLSILMKAGIREILLISTPDHIPLFEHLLENGNKLGLDIRYKIQDKPEGLAQAFILGEEFIGKDPVALILGDNIFYGDTFEHKLRELITNFSVGGDIFGYWVADPERYGVVEFNNKFEAVSIEEKPEKPKSSYAVPGIYFYDNNVVSIARGLRKSPRGEYEITDINNAYLEKRKLRVHLLNTGSAWLDTGTPESMQEASTFIQVIEKRMGLKIGCLEEIALQMGYITKKGLQSIIASLPQNSYREYLLQVADRYDN